MTQNQISFAKLQEDRRHNLATEGYTGIELQETARHNQVGEDINWYTAIEQGRHNLAQEGVNWYAAENTANLQYWQGQQAQSQRFLNETRAVVEDAAYALDRWYKENAVAINAVDAATRERSQRAAERKVDAEIANIFRRLNIDERVAGVSKDKVTSEVVKNIAGSTKTVAEIVQIIMKLIA